MRFDGALNVSVPEFETDVVLYQGIHRTLYSNVPSAQRERLTMAEVTMSVTQPASRLCYPEGYVPQRGVVRCARPCST